MFTKLMFIGTHVNLTARNVITKDVVTPVLPRVVDV